MGVVLPFDGARGILKPGGPQTLNPAYFAVPNGLVGYWGFDPDCLDFTNSLAFDLSGNGKTGTLSGATKPTFANGQVGGALTFNGTNSYVDCGLTTGNFTGPFSYAAWVNAAATSGSPVVMGSGFLNAVNRVQTLAINPDAAHANKMEFQIFNGVQHVAVSTANVLTGVWEHWVGVCTGSQILLYRNGALDNAITDSTLPSLTTKRFLIGANDVNAGAANFWNGSIDDARPYNRALDPWEVIQLYQAGLAGRRDAGVLLPQSAELDALLSPIRFRKTLSGFGSGVGKRQLQGA